MQICDICTYIYNSCQKMFPCLTKICISTIKAALRDHTSSVQHNLTFTVAFLHTFEYFSVSMFIGLPFGMSLTFLLGLLSAVLIAVAFRHLAT